MKRLKKREPWEIQSPWLRLLLFIGGTLCMGLAVAIAVLWINFDSISAIQVWATKSPNYLLLTAFIYAAMIALLGSLLDRLWVSGAVVGVAALLLALVDHFKTAINGTPLNLADFGLATQLGEVAGVAGSLRPPVDFWRALVILLLCAGLLFLVRTVTVLKGKLRWGSALVSFALLLALFLPGSSALVGKLFSVDVYARMPAASNVSFYGLTLALWRDIVIQDKAAPEGYSEAYMQDVLARIDEKLEEKSITSEEKEAVAPNIIFVLSEAFFDLTRSEEHTSELQSR